MDPIENGCEIFHGILEEFGRERLSDPATLERFFQRLLDETRGLVILDFLDLASWDCIEAFRVDSDTGVLTLHWHDYRKAVESEADREMRQMVFPASLYSLGIAVKTVAPLEIGDAAVFLVNGHSKTPKEIKALYRGGSSEFEFVDRSFFRKRVVRKVESDWEVLDFHCTPIYSIALIPKNLRFSSGDSRNLLFHFNIDDAVDRIGAVVQGLEETAPGDEDAICEKVNTARRVLESVLKIECCYRRIEIDKPYSQILLGDLVKLVRRDQEADFGPMFDQLAALLNEFSHDSGKPIVLERAKIAALLVQLYTRLLQEEIGAYWNRHG